MKTLILISALLIIGLENAKAQNNLKTRTVATNLDTPWEILWGPDNYIWVTERLGKISRINPENGAVSEVILISEAKEVGEGGLLGMVTDPDFSVNNYFYVAYNYYAAGNDYREKIVRFTFNPSTGKAGNPFILLENIDGANNHNGCRMVISPDKKLIFTTGDAQVTSNSQDVDNINGKTLRINLDGTIPDDNPVQNSPVWTWGHRNPQGLVYSPGGNILYSSEHGASSNDEINIIQKGRNYGWPNVEGFCDIAGENSFCINNNVVEPIFAWTPTLAVAGIDFYNSDLIPEWKNSLLVTSLKASRITQLLLNEGGTEVIKSTDFYTNAFGRLRDICVSPDGKVYTAVSNRDGRGTPKADDDKIIEITPVTTEIAEIADDNFVSIYPNPGKDFIYITFTKALKANAKYTLLNMSGQILKTGNLESVTNKLFLPGNYEGLAIIQINADNQVFSKKILITNK
ncbi:MAG TPA: PQQ-dependent sugar dehydrogenase [Draconibacterium sp.]|nr:PQQ-dependent sugar dehydrogenase [Draconibacterium sp.]